MENGIKFFIIGKKKITRRYYRRNLVTIHIIYRGCISNYPKGFCRFWKVWFLGGWEVCMGVFCTEIAWQKGFKIPQLLGRWSCFKIQAWENKRKLEVMFLSFSRLYFLKLFYAKKF